MTIKLKIHKNNHTLYYERALFLSPLHFRSSLIRFGIDQYWQKKNKNVFLILFDL